MCYWLCECVTVAMNGCWLMWLGDCCIRLCWWGLWSCWENCTGCSAARLPVTLLITGTVWDCDVFKPGGARHNFGKGKGIVEYIQWPLLYACAWSHGGMEDLLCAMAMTPDRGMMRFCVCWWLWWELWMFVSVLTGGRPPPEPEIWRKKKDMNKNHGTVSLLLSSL